MTRCMLDKENFLGCAFDGASAMVKLGGMLKDYTGGQSLYIHCLAHCCNLIIKDVISTCSLFTEPMQTCHDLYTLIGISPKRILILEKFHKEYSEGSNVTAQRLQDLSVTRWTARGKAAKVIFRLKRGSRESANRSSKGYFC